MNDTQQEIVLVAYHANCIDGFTSAWVAHTALKKKGYKVELLPMQYTSDSTEELFNCLAGKKGEGQCSYDKLYVVDFSLALDVLSDLERMYPELLTTILDHHKTAFEMYQPDVTVNPYLSWRRTTDSVDIYIDMQECGASLCWKYFNPGERKPLLIKYVKDYDLWQFAYGDETKWVNKYLCSEKKTIENWDAIAYGMTSHIDMNYILERGEELQKTHDGAVANIVANAMNLKLDKKTCLIAECKNKSLVSDAGHILAKQSGTFGALYNIDIEANKTIWSLRSNGDYDVSVIAKKYGGGGHKNAAGFETTFIPSSPSINRLEIKP